jgi:homoserine kinase type II
MDELIEKLYGLKILQEFTVDSGTVNSARVILTNRGKFFQKIFLRCDSDTVEKIINSNLYLAENGIPVPRPLGTLDGQYLIRRNDPCVLFEFVDGSQKKVLSAENVFGIGRLIAEMHNAFENYDRRGEFIEDNKDYNSTERYEQHIALLNAIKTSEAIDIIREYAHLRQQRKIDFNRLPLALLHADLGKSNLLFQGEEIKAVLDFEFMRYDNRIYDLAISTIELCMDNGKLDRNLMRDLIKGYESVSQLRPSEIAFFPEILKITLWDRWSSIYLFYKEFEKDLSRRKPDFRIYREKYLGVKDDPVL